MLLVLSSASVLPASFDCGQAKPPIETSICADAALSVLDDKMAGLYARLSKSTPDIVALQKHWLKAVRGRCQDTACLTSAYKRWIEDLQDIASGKLRIDKVTPIQLIEGYNPESKYDTKVMALQADGTGVPAEYHFPALAPSVYLQVLKKNIRKTVYLAYAVDEDRTKWILLTAPAK